MDPWQRSCCNPGEAVPSLCIPRPRAASLPASLGIWESAHGNPLACPPPGPAPHNLGVVCVELEPSRCQLVDWEDEALTSSRSSAAPSLSPASHSCSWCQCRLHQDPGASVASSGSGEALQRGGDFHHHHHHHNNNNTSPPPLLPFLCSEPQPAGSENVLPQPQPRWGPSLPPPGARRRWGSCRQQERLESKAGAGAGAAGRGTCVGWLDQAVEAPFLGNTSASLMRTFFFSHPT